MRATINTTSEIDLGRTASRSEAGCSASLFREGIPPAPTSIEASTAPSQSSRRIAQESLIAVAHVSPSTGSQV